MTDTQLHKHKQFKQLYYIHYTIEKIQLARKEEKKIQTSQIRGKLYSSVPYLFQISPRYCGERKVLFKMKTVQLREVVKYENSDKWFSEEVSGKLLMTSIKFLSFDREFIKVSKI